MSTESSFFPHPDNQAFKEKLGVIKNHIDRASTLLKSTVLLSNPNEDTNFKARIDKKLQESQGYLATSFLLAASPIVVKPSLQAASVGPIEEALRAIESQLESHTPTLVTLLDEEETTALSTTGVENIQAVLREVQLALTQVQSLTSPVNEVEDDELVATDAATPVTHRKKICRFFRGVGLFGVLPLVGGGTLGTGIAILDQAIHLKALEKLFDISNQFSARFAHIVGGTLTGLGAVLLLVCLAVIIRQLRTYYSNKFDRIYIPPTSSAAYPSVPA